MGRQMDRNELRCAVDPKCSVELCHAPAYFDYKALQILSQDLFNVDRYGREVHGRTKPGNDSLALYFGFFWLKRRGALRR
jgi:hypothetical protein